MLAPTWTWTRGPEKKKGGGKQKKMKGGEQTGTRNPKPEP